MRKLNLFCLVVILFVTSCEKAQLEQGDTPKRPVLPNRESSVVITGDNMLSNTRGTSDRVEFTGGYATGGGLYSGDAKVSVAAVPYSGYQLVSFIGGAVGGNSSQFRGSNQYTFPIESQDWKFSVSFKKEYTISVNADTGGTVSGGGIALEGDNVTVSASASSGYSFEGWYEGGSKVSSSLSYTFTVSSNRTLTAKFEIPQPVDNYIDVKATISGFRTIRLTITSDYPIESPVNVEYAAEGEFVVSKDERDVICYYQSRFWKETLKAGQSEWIIDFIPDEYGNIDIGLPTNGTITKITDVAFTVTEFSDSKYNYIEGRINL